MDTLPLDKRIVAGSDNMSSSANDEPSLSSSLEKHELKLNVAR